jgi:hypothetical protein
MPQQVVVVMVVLGFHFLQAFPQRMQVAVAVVGMATEGKLAALVVLVVAVMVRRQLQRQAVMAQ